MLTVKSIVLLSILFICIALGQKPLAPVTLIMSHVTFNQNKKCNDFSMLVKVTLKGRGLCTSTVTLIGSQPRIMLQLIT